VLKAKCPVLVATLRTSAVKCFIATLGFTYHVNSFVAFVHLLYFDNSHLFSAVRKIIQIISLSTTIICRHCIK